MIDTIETNGARNASPVAIAVTPSGRKVKPEPPEPVELAKAVSNESEAHKELKRMFQATIKNYARGFNSLREAIETCRKAGVTDKELESWAEEAGWKLQTFRNTMSAIRKDGGEVKRIVTALDKRRRAAKDPVKKTRAEQGYKYLLGLCDGSVKTVKSVALAISRMADEAMKAEDNKAE